MNETMQRDQAPLPSSLLSFVRTMRLSGTGARRARHPPLLNQRRPATVRFRNGVPKTKVVVSKAATSFRIRSVPRENWTAQFGRQFAFESIIGRLGHVLLRISAKRISGGARAGMLLPRRRNDCSRHSNSQGYLPALCLCFSCWAFDICFLCGTGCFVSRIFHVGPCVIVRASVS